MTAMERPLATAAATPTLAYLGWSGRGNLGDDAVELAMRQAIPGVTFMPLPLGVAQTVRFLVTTAGRRPVRDARVLLGGGTVIGRANWRHPLRVGLATARRRPAHMLGAGVEDPVFQGRHSFSGRDELRRWRRVLATFDRITVRGPRSAELLAGIGVEARVVGDPALLLTPSRHAAAVSEGVVAINLGHGDDLWGHDQSAVVAAVAAAVRGLAAGGLQVRWLVANHEDLEDTRRCARLAGQHDPDVRIVTDPVEFLDTVAGCAVLVGQRLHAVVLAAAAGVPPVMLEYQPKCLDFMRSIGRERWSVRTDRVVPGGLVEMVTELAAARGPQGREVAAAVAPLRAALTDEARLIRDRVAA